MFYETCVIPPNYDPRGLYREVPEQHHHQMKPSLVRVPRADYHGTVDSVQSSPVGRAAAPPRCRSLPNAERRRARCVTSPGEKTCTLSSFVFTSQYLPQLILHRQPAHKPLQVDPSGHRLTARASCFKSLYIGSVHTRVHICVCMIRARHSESKVCCRGTASARSKSLKAEHELNLNIRRNSGRLSPITYRDMRRVDDSTITEKCF